MNIVWRSIWATTRPERSRKWRDTFRNRTRVMIPRRRRVRQPRLLLQRLLRRLPRARQRLIPASRHSSGLRRVRSKKRARFFRADRSPQVKLEQEFLQGIEAGEARVFDALVLDENLERLAHPLGINQRLEEQPGADLLGFAHGRGLQIGEIAVTRKGQQEI